MKARILAALCLGLSACVEATGPSSIDSGAATLSNLSLVPIGASVSFDRKIKIQASLRNSGSQTVCYWELDWGPLMVASIKSADGAQALLPNPNATTSSGVEPVIEIDSGDRGPFQAEAAIKHTLQAGATVIIEGEFDEPANSTYHSAAKGYGRNYKSHDRLKYDLRVAVSSCGIDEFYWDRVGFVNGDSMIDVQF